MHCAHSLVLVTLPAYTFSVLLSCYLNNRKGVSLLEEICCNSSQRIPFWHGPTSTCSEVGQ